MSTKETVRVGAGDPSDAWEGFSPLRRASRAKRAAVMFLGPVAWIVALAVLIEIVHEEDAIEIGLAVAAASFVLAFVALAVTRYVRARRDEAW
jgi:hypothetical protein